MAAIVGVGGCCAVGVWRMGDMVKDAQAEFQKQQEEAAANRKARTVTVTAAELLKEFQADEAVADDKYSGKYLEVTGVVERAGRSGQGIPFVILHGGDENAKFKVECFFDFGSEADPGRAERLPKGKTVTVRGEYRGRVSNVQLRECVLAPPAAGPKGAGE